MFNKLFDKFNFNQKEGYSGLILLSISITLLCFSIAYLIEASSWIGEDGEIAANWFTSGGIVLGIGIILLFISTALIKKSSRKKDLTQTSKKKLENHKINFNQRNGFLGLVMIPTGIIFLIHGLIYRREATKWFWAGINTATEWYFQEASKWFTTSMIMFIIGAILFCGGAFLLVNEHRKNK